MLSSNRTIDQTVRSAFPQPIAAALHRMLAAPTDGERLRGVYACFEILLRTLASYLLVDSLRCHRGAGIERELGSLEKPSMGHWVHLVRQLLKAASQPDAPPPFFVEALGWYVDETGKPTAAARKIEELIAGRNKHAHEAGLVAGEELRQRLADALEALRTILASLDWLRGYRLMRVCESKPLRGRPVRYEARVTFFCGAEAEPIAETVTLGAELFIEAVYVVSPSGEQLLEVTPLVRVEHDARQGKDRLFLFRRTRRSKRVVLVNDATGTEVSDLIESEVGRLPFERWVDLPDHSALLVRNDHPEGGLRAQHITADEEEVLSDRFTVKGRLGEGGMAVVLHVHDDFEDEEVALKVLKPDLCEGPAFRRRFNREARLMRRLDHPNLLRVIDVGNLPDGRLWLTMPLMTGGSLRDRLEGPRPNEEQLGSWMEQMLAALESLHTREQPIVHRDVKPSNFLITADETLVLTDFGIALQQEQARLTRTLERMGSLAFMSPEQRAGEEVGPASDIYSLGVVFHELLTGESKILEPGRGIDGPAGDLVRRMTRPEPEERPTATEVLGQLTARRGAPPRPAAARPTPATPPAAPPNPATAPADPPNPATAPADPPNSTPTNPLLASLATWLRGPPKPAGPNRDELCGRFWTHFLPLTDRHARIEPPQRYWVPASAGYPGLSYTYVLLAAAARVELYIDRPEQRANKGLFDSLLAQKGRIERSFGQPLEWQRLDRGRACRISCAIHVGGWKDSRTWPGLEQALLDAMTRLERAMQERLDEQHARKQAPPGSGTPPPAAAWCSTCKKKVVPAGDGRCGTCGKPTGGSVLSGLFTKKR